MLSQSKFSALLTAYMAAFTYADVSAPVLAQMAWTGACAPYDGTNAGQSNGWTDQGVMDIILDSNGMIDRLKNFTIPTPDDGMETFSIHTTTGASAGANLDVWVVNNNTHSLGQQFRVDIHGINDPFPVLGSYWIQTNNSCTTPMTFNAADVGDINVGARTYDLVATS